MSACLLNFEPKVNANHPLKNLNDLFNKNSDHDVMPPEQAGALKSCTLDWVADTAVCTDPTYKANTPSVDWFYTQFSAQLVRRDRPARSHMVRPETYGPTHMVRLEATWP